MCGEPVVDVICAVEADIIPFNNAGSVVWGSVLSLWEQEGKVIHTVAWRDFRKSGVSYGPAVRRRRTTCYTLIVE